MKAPAKSKFHEASPLLELLEVRFKALGLDSDKPYRVPVRHPQRDEQIEIAARRHAEANPTDPFAYGRAKMHMHRGLALVSEVAADAYTILEVKRKQRVEAEASHAEGA